MTPRRRATNPPIRWAILLQILALGAAAPAAQRQMEHLDRGLVAVRRPGGVFLGWRLLGDDDPGVGFRVERRAAGPGADPVACHEGTVTDRTCFFDRSAADVEAPLRYRVVAVVDGRDVAASAEVSVWPEPFVDVPLRTPDGYRPGDASVGDLDGDGSYELVIKMEGRARDNAQAGPTDPVQLHAYRLDGELLWRIDVGRNVRAGAHYTQFLVYDLDGDGRAEVACKTADATVDGTGRVLGDADADHRDAGGRILRGPEFLTVFDGRSGAALASARYVPQRAPGRDDPDRETMARIWGDDYGNRMDRFLACVAYLDGERPSLVFARGYYRGRRAGTGRTVVAAWNFRDGRLERVWTFDSAEVGQQAVGQGNHQIAAADVDGDGRDEVLYGAMVVDDDGTLSYSTGLGHGDAYHVADMLPSRPGLEVFSPHEDPSAYGRNAVTLRDARTGEILWGLDGDRDVGRGLAVDCDPRWPGYEMWSSLGPGLFTASRSRAVDGAPPRGHVVAETRPRSINFAVWWDGDLLRELLDADRITKWDWESEREVELLTLSGCRAVNGSKATPSLSADLFGDWREEVVLPTADGRALRVHTTTVPTSRRLVTLMHDPQYRLAVAWQNVGYNQPPHPGFFLGHGMDEPPRPRIRTVRPVR